MVSLRHWEDVMMLAVSNWEHSKKLMADRCVHMYTIILKIENLKKKNFAWILSYGIFITMLSILIFKKWFELKIFKWHINKSYLAPYLAH